MKFTVLTIFPEMFSPFWEHGIIRRAISNKLIDATAISIRAFAKGKHRVTDDRPYGGGCGMVMKPEPLGKAIRAAEETAPGSKKILLSPQGRLFDQKLASELLNFKGLILVCGRYEGFDERICQKYIDFELSIGDFILTGGELAAMVVIDALTRLIPGTLGNEDSAEQDSFSGDLLKYAHYTRPASFEGEGVPEVLRTGDHSAIEKWRLESSLIRTFLKRKDLMENRSFSKAEIEILKQWCRGIESIIRAQSLCGADPLSGDQ